jgi:hypothetical protein
MASSPESNSSNNTFAIAMTFFHSHLKARKFSRLEEALWFTHPRVIDLLAAAR